MFSLQCIFAFIPIMLTVSSIIIRWNTESTSSICFKNMPLIWNIGLLLGCITIYTLFKDFTNHYVLYVLFPFLCTIILCQLLIVYFKNKSGQPIRLDGPPSHFTKSNIPIFGGVAFITSCLLVYLTIYLTNTVIYNSVHAMYIIIFLSFALIGFIDDLLKITKQNSKGMPGKLRLMLECLISLIVYWQIHDSINTTVNIPFIGNMDFDVFFIIWFIFIITGTANAVNLTDGLDGLVTVPVILILLTFCIYDTHSFAALIIPLIFACLGFLTLNTKPAKIFMGDTGALALGGVIGYTSLVLKCEFAVAFVGLILVLETLSDIIQVVSFKLRKKRVFKMAPLHHHFELLGWSETKIVIAFWAISIILFLIHNLILQQ